MRRFIWSSLLPLMLFLWVVDRFSCLSSSSLNPTPLCLPEHASALLQFKNTISVDEYNIDYSCDVTYPKTNSWNESMNCCSWEGVTCDKATGQVIGLDLSCSKLVGFLSPNTTLTRLLALKRLNLAHNNFSGSSIPSGFGHLVTLTHLDLSLSHFSGLVPSEISSLSKLISLDLSRNDLKFESHSFGMLRRNLSRLENLFLDFVKMSDVVPTTSFLNLSSSLKRLSLSRCELRGEVPSEIFQLPNLESLNLSQNSFIGYLPESDWSSPLRWLDLSQNQLRGSIPSSIGNLTKITYLDFSCNEFEGQIPDAIGNLQKLTTLYFSNCTFSGQLPSSFFDLTELTDLDLSSNNLSGIIKSDLLLKLQSLDSMYLSSNNFSGIDKFDALSKLKNLTNLDLSNNKLLSLELDGDHHNGVNSTFEQLQYLNLASCNIDQFPSFLRSAKNLYNLDLSYNKIEGSISKWETKGWERLSSLDLSHNSLTSLEQYPGKNLAILDLRSNLLQGPFLVPPPSIEGFFISDNRLTGEIPPSFCNLTSVEVFDLSRNDFGGMIPACLGNLSRVTTISLQGNNFHGKIPDSFCAGDYAPLTTLALNDNRLEGLLPRSLINCTSLQFLNLANNSLNDLFPHWLGTLENLQVLILRSNRFHGALKMSSLVPCQQNQFLSSCFSNLQVIDLSENEFTGSLPTKFFQSLRAMEVVLYGDSDLCDPNGYTPCLATMSIIVDEKFKNSAEVTMKKLELEIDLENSLTGFTLIDFSHNGFSGRIPEALGKLHSLLVLNLSHNCLTGPLPPSLGNISALESLDLSSNKLRGRIPSELTKLTFLEVLNLSRNNFVGPIPVGKQFNTFENDSYADNLDLCGFPLSKKCGNNEEPEPPTSKLAEAEEGHGIAFIWKLVMMGYGCGVVLGLSTGYMVLTTGRPWWLVRMIERDLQRKFTRWVDRMR